MNIARAEPRPPRYCRPHGNNDREGGHPVDDPLPTFIADLKCEPHDPNKLPHLHSADVIQRLFPSIDAAPEPANSKDYKVDGGVFLSSDPDHPWMKHTRVGDIGSADSGVGKDGTRRQRLRAEDCLQHPRGARAS